MSFATGKAPLAALLGLAVPPLGLTAPLLGLALPPLGLGNVTGAAVCVGLNEADSPPELLGLAELLEVLPLPLEEPELGLDTDEEEDAAPAEEEEERDVEEEEGEEVMG